MKVLITSDWNFSVVNGVVTSVKNLRDELLKMGHEVRIVTLSSTFKTYKRDDVYYIGSVSANKVYPEARLRAKRMKKILRHIEEWGPDIVHSQCEFSTFSFARDVADELDIPLIHTYHTVYEDYIHYLGPSRIIGKTIVTQLSKHVAKNCDAMIVPTEKVKHLLEGYKIKTPMSIIPTGIVLDRFQENGLDIEGEKLREKLGYNSDETVLAAIGRLAKEKNTIEIMRFVSGIDIDKVKLMIVGDGPYREKLEEKAKRCPNNDRFNFVGMVAPTEVAKHYRVGDIFVCASTSETQGLTYVEALASGLPILCKRDECLEGVIEDGYNGWQYDTKEEFVSRLNEYISLSPGEKKKMSDNAFESAEKFSSRRFASDVVALYEKCILEKHLEDIRLKKKK